MNTVSATLVSPDRLASSGARLVLLMLRARAILVLLLLLIFFSVLSPTFLTTANLSILSKHVAITAILAIGTTFVILTSGIDLSLGSVVGLGGMVAGYILTQGVTIGRTTYHPDLSGAVLATIVVSLVVGALNGVLVTRAGVAPFIATLGTLYIARGAALLISNGKTFPNLTSHSPSFALIGQSFLLRIPTPVWMMMALFAIAAFVAAKTPFGRHVYAVGGNERASRLAGIQVDKVKMYTYLISAICAGVVGLIIASQLESSHPATGESFELNAIAAVVLGGTSLMGGRGSITGSLIGAFVIGVLADGLVMMGVSEFWQMIIKGTVIVLAVAVDQLQSRIQARFLPLLLRSDAKAGA